MMSPKLASVLALLGLSLSAPFVLLSDTVGGQQSAADSSAAATPQQARTPWGDPNLEGVWRYESAIPLERPVQLGDKATLASEEVEARARRERELQENRTKGLEGDAVGRKSLAESPIRENEYNSFWQDHGRPRKVSDRTSLIVDP